MDGALQFLAAFPEASSWHVTVLTPDKRCIVNKPALPTDEFRKSLPAWLQLSGVHVFVRPLLARLVFLDLDNFKGNWETLVELQPRIISETSPGNFQWWGTLSEVVPAKQATSVTKQLQTAFGADPHSTGSQQQGRLPGSVNPKPGKNCLVRFLHQTVTDIASDVLLRVTPKTVLQMAGGRAQAVEKPSAPGAAAPAVDRSRNDWKLACEYFEQNPGSSVQEATDALKGHRGCLNIFFGHCH